jgi:sulfite exporter TauE/SafE
MIYSAFIIGFVGSLHCVGMCGPIAMMLPSDTSIRWKFVFGKVLYNSGRILTYSFLGLFVGFIGESASYFISQKTLSISLGMLILIAIFLPKSIQNKLNLHPQIFRFSNFIKSSLSSFFKKRSLLTQFFFGILNGLLPCGLIYAALSVAFLTENITGGMIFMIFFGLGTLPMMLGISLGATWLRKIFGGKLPKLIPIIYSFLGLWLIFRGLIITFPHIIKQNIDLSIISFCY